MGVDGTAELAFRLAVAAVAIGGPTVLYLGLWRFLAWLRDDALIDRLASRGAVEEPRPAPADVLASATAGLDRRRCSDCGTRTVTGATRCRRCGGAPDDGS
ncbi:hypothetical protein [Halorubrum sp. DTA46]|uniref:hypothetical protein n=1 Tax=Halorubrum sp. DTA46 TaxID=3402162 RepID=UPI003AAB5CCE